MNKVILKGHIANDPEVLNTKTGKTLCKFTIAVNRRFKKEETDFIYCTAWDKTAEFISNYLNKGSEVLVVGRLEIDKYENQEGKMQFKTNVVLEEVYSCGKKSDSKPNTTNTKETPSSNLPKRNNTFPDEVPF